MNIVEKNISIKKIIKTFPKLKNENDYNKLKLTTEGIYSVSGNKASIHLCYLIKKYFKNNKDLTVTDATANNGSDTIMLGLEFNKVNAIEKNKINFEVLKNNIDIYNLDNVKLYNDSLMNIIPQINQDVIFIDAPWKQHMDEDYKESENLKLYIDKKEISTVYNELKKYCKLFIFKVPYNYDFSFFIHNTKLEKYYIIAHKQHEDIKFYYIIIPS